MGRLRLCENKKRPRGLLLLTYPQKSVILTKAITTLQEIILRILAFLAAIADKPVGKPAMPQKMSVQAFATERNGQVELFIDFLLNRFLETLSKQGKISDYSIPVLQESFSADDCSDVFDHYLELTPTWSNEPIQIWGQTTCYKGNESGSPEPNKTYEIRETLVEALGLRRCLMGDSRKNRIIHFTIGSTDYTYPWFTAAKDNAFDLSVYSGNQVGDNDIFLAIRTALLGVSTEFEAFEKLELAVKVNGGLNIVFKHLMSQMMEWFDNQLPISGIADAQAKLLNEIRNSRTNILKYSLGASCNGGEDIKGRAIRLLQGGIDDDPDLIETLQQLLSGKPFLRVAMEALEDWKAWTKFYIPRPAHLSLSLYIKKLWTGGGDSQLILRRLLIRMDVGNAVQYPADLNINGISEHNLYSGIHDSAQVNKIVESIFSRYSDLGINESKQLYIELSGANGKKILRDSLRLESYNGASLKPSFVYVEKIISKDFDLKSFSEAGLAAPTAYHARFTTERVDPYNNLKVIVRRSDQKPLAILKAKYFRKQEFPRRAKEESYVGLTAKYDYIDGHFIEKYKGIPFLMFVDMEKSLQPPSYAITRMVTSGWDVFFSIKELRKFLVSI